MSPKFHLLEISDIRQETADCVSLAFQIPIALANDYDYLQGQNVTLKTTMEGEEVRRSYSICSSPVEGELRIAIKQVEGGKFSTFANQHLKKGDFINVMTPNGRFHTLLSADNAKNYVGIAAGSGITPIMSILKTTLMSEPNSTFTLIYGNQNTASVIFKEEIEALKNRFMGRFRVYYVLSREAVDVPLFHGRINGEKCHTFFTKLINPTTVSEVFLCGPEQMIFEAKDALVNLGVDSKNIHFELFGTSLPTASQRKKVPTTDNAPKSRVTVQLDGLAFDFDLAYDSDNILDAAMAHGADLPFACKGGVCCTCKAKILEGEIEMAINYGLEPDEIERNFVLTCQAFPKTERVVISFDEK